MSFDHRRRGFDAMSRFGLGGLLSPFSQSLDDDLLGRRGRYSPYDYDCESCRIGFGGRHVCLRAQFLQTQVDNLKALRYGDGCDCPDCAMGEPGYRVGGLPL
jgi:hypothetical protein